MIKMQDYEHIRRCYFRYKHSIRKISRDTGICRPTIRKAIEGEEPKYKLKKHKHKPVIGPYVEIIKEWLIKDKKVKEKQRHTAKRIHDRLVKEHKFKGGESTVRKLVKELKQELGLVHKEAFIPSDPDKRHGAEVDWGQASLILKGQEVCCHMFCMRSKYSGKIFVKLYPVEVQECFFDGHTEAFIYFGGVFDTIVYDNLTTAVKKVLRGREREEQAAFISFKAHYCFESVFCNRSRGNEKGGVEGLVGYARRNFLTPIPQCQSYEEVNNHLLEECDARDQTKTHGQQLKIGELFDKEKGSLIAFTKPYNNYRLIFNVLVDKFLTVQLATNRYSVPHEYVGANVNIELGLQDIRIIYKNKVIAEHPREFKKRQWILNPWHYMEVLKRKTRAFEGSRIFTSIENQWDPIIKQLWETQTTKLGEYKGSKDFLESIIYFQDKSYLDMVAVIELAIENRTSNADSVKMLYQSIMEERKPASKLKVEHIEVISNFTIPAPDISKFNTLLEAGNG